MKLLKSIPVATATLLLLSTLYLVFILRLPQDTVFYSGDGGLKFLMSKQFLDGIISPALVLHPAHPEAIELWAEGLYPFGPPFVYNIDSRWRVSFPMYFPLASAPFLGVMGWRGLYVLPAATAVLLWLWLAVRCHSAGMLATSVCAALISLVFASPLTLYAAMFWEHVPAALLASIPLLLLIPSERIRNGRSTGTIGAVAGVLSGAGVFLRPEVLIFLACLIVALLVCFRLERIRLMAYFALGVVSSLGVFVSVNWLIYGNVFGQHAAQVLDGTGLSIVRIVNNSRTLYILFAKNSPWLGAVVLCLPLVLLSPFRRKREFIACFLALVVSIPLIAAIVPNTGGKQWGPRYLMILIPWGSVLVAFVVDASIRFRFYWKWLALLLLTASLVLGVWMNVWRGAKHLASDYQDRVLPALRLIQNQPQQFVVVSNQWIAQELAALADTKVFIWPRNEAHVDLLKSRLREAGIKSVLHVTYHGKMPPSQLGPIIQVGASESYIIHLATFEK